MRIPLGHPRSNKDLLSQLLSPPTQRMLFLYLLEISGGDAQKVRIAIEAVTEKIA